MYEHSEPYDHGLLDVGDGNHVYWDVSGNPAGKPAVLLHGGPGVTAPGGRRYFDPAAYRVIQFHQRGVGLSTPSVVDPETDLSVNTTEHLLADMEKLREHLGVERWLVFGGSWGVTLGFAYAERFPERVSELVLVAITNSRPAETDWLYRGLGSLFPEAWDRFREGAGDGAVVDVVAAYNRLLNDPDPAVREKAARDWCAWEAAAVDEDPADPDPRWADPDFRMSLARTAAHYFHHDSWLEDGILLREAGKLAGIPGVMVHGRLDLSAPLGTAWAMAKAWPDAELKVIPDAGHHARGAMGEALLEAVDRFR
ncbi:prolyl aminopeptidase [Amycolatopsis sp. 195334CR]|uniref:prolyl aminopeptidase n=1 Tax=Amycolatopsis sp. 195334CR TaxID=2814588 RepID=UPI001A8BF621|nr:prolyl aminopeptidase [Amycolatopsis sp. 195334CR]MBN6034382.1 prolyl aminopeptidase [Amycolatopsis sp. 195334CR]